MDEITNHYLFGSQYKTKCIEPATTLSRVVIVTVF